jgi:ATP-dependent helicase/nuclease subunit A
VVTPSGLIHKGDSVLVAKNREEIARGGVDLEETVALPRTPRGGSALGLAVHAVLQWLDLDTLANLDTLADWAAKEHGVSVADVRRYARQAAESEPVRRAVALGRYWREVPVTVEIDGTLLEGAIDLLYEREDGSLVVVDYKTDRVQPATVAERAAHYRLQGGVYALAVERATGRQVASVEFVFAALDGGEPVTYDAEAVSALTREVTALLVGAQR